MTDAPAIAGAGLKVSVFTTVPPGVYSGGRYLSMMLAYAMARAGATVSYVTNNAPLFERDFSPYEQAHPVRRIVTADFALPEDLVSDWVVVIPTGGFDNRFYNAALDHARRQGARVALLSFETPNWYGALSPFPRSPMPTESWRQVVAGGGLVITIAEEGIAPARAYFGAAREDLRFGFWHPAINDLAAAAAGSHAGPRRRVTAFVRTEDPHKGAQDLFALPPEALEGHVLSLVFGRGVSEPYVAALRRHFAPARDFGIEVHAQIDDVAKFRLLGRSRLLLFPSYFEGFGYPPVEAAWMGVPTVAYDLPLLREVAGDAVTTVPKGDRAAFAAAVAAALAAPAPAPDAVRARLRVAPDTLSAGRKALALLAGAADLPPVRPVPAAIPIPRNPRGEEPAARALQSRHGEGWHLFDLETRLTGDVLRVSGRIAGELSDANPDGPIRFAMPGAQLPDAWCGPAQGGSRPFATEGILRSWPGAGAARVQISLLRKGAAPVRLGHVAVSPNWAQLLVAGSRGGHMPAPADADHPETLILADPAGIAGDPVQSLALAEIAETLWRLGRRSRILIPAEARPPSTATEADLLPRGDALERLPAAQMAGRIATALAGGAAVVLAGGLQALAPAGRPAWLIVPPPAGPGSEGTGVDGQREGTDAIVILSDAIAAPRRLAAAADPRLGRRSLADRDRDPVIVLVPPGPPCTPASGLPAAAAGLLKRIEVREGRLRVLVPARLWGVPGPVPAGITGLVEPLAEADLAAALSRYRRIAGLALGAEAAGPEAAAAPPDAATLALLAAFGAPLLQPGADDGLPAAPAPAPGGIAALVGELIAPAPPASALRRIAPDLVARRPPPPRPDLPCARPGEVLSFSNTVEGTETALLAGWRDRNLYGARLAASAGLVGFRLDPAAGDAAAVEVMLRIGGKPEPGLGFRVLLNGRLIGRIDKAVPGVANHVFAVAPPIWKAATEAAAGEPATQMLELVREQGAAAGDAVEVALVAVALRAEAPALPAWERIARDARGAAPLLAATDEDDGGPRSAGFGRGAAPGFAVPLAGWSGPEPGWIWSDGPEAVLGFRPALAGRGPALLTLSGGTLARPGAEGDPAAGQRLRIAVPGGPELAELALAAESGPGSGVALPAAAIAARIENLLLSFPDARRPSDLGLGGDTRLLGLRLEGLGFVSLDDRVDRAAVTLPAPATARALPADPVLPAGPGPAASARLAVRVGAGALRLTGPGGPPADCLFALAGTPVLARAVAAEDGGWEACLPLPAATVAAGAAAICILVPDPAAAVLPAAIESWAAPAAGPAPETAPETVPLVVVLQAMAAGQPDARTWATAAGAGPATAPLPLPVRLNFSAGSAAAGALATGWSEPEPEGTWSDGPAARLQWPGGAGPAVLALEGAAFTDPAHPMQRITVAAGGRVLGTLLLRPESPGRHLLVLPGHADGIDLGFPDAISPAALGISPDGRDLGLRISAAAILPLDPAEGIPAATAAPEIGPVAVLDAATHAEGIAVWLAGTGPQPWALAAPGSAAMIHPVATGEEWRACLALPWPVAGAATRIAVLAGPPDPDAPLPETAGWIDLALPQAAARDTARTGEPA